MNFREFSLLAVNNEVMVVYAIEISFIECDLYSTLKILQKYISVAHEE